MTERKVLRIGNSLGVTLPPDVLEAAGLREGQTVTVRVREGAIELEPERSFQALLERWAPLAPDLELAEVSAALAAERESH